MNPSKDDNSSESDSSSPDLIVSNEPTSLHSNSSALIRLPVNFNAAIPSPRNPNPRRPRGNDNMSLPSESSFRSSPQTYNPSVAIPRSRNITPLRPSGTDVVSGPSSAYYSNPLTFNPPVVTPRRRNDTSSESNGDPIPRPPLAGNAPSEYVPDRVPTSSTAAPTSIVFEVEHPPAGWPPAGWQSQVAGSPLVVGQPGAIKEPEAVDEDYDEYSNDPPPYRPEPSLAERRRAIELQLTEGRRLVGTAAELQAQRERMEVRYEVSVREVGAEEVDVEEALAREHCRNSRRHRLEEEAQCPERMTRAMTAKDKRDEFEHTKTMLKGAAYMFNKRAATKQEVERPREPSIHGSDEGYQSGEAPKHIKFAPCPEGHNCEKCKSVETREDLEEIESPLTSERPDPTEIPKTAHE